MKTNFFILLLFIFGFQICFGQDTLSVDEDRTLAIEQVDNEKKITPYNPLSPAKAAFYSAVLPGLGQAYNEKYWKIPLVYAALGTGVAIFIHNNEQYHRFRDAYKMRLAGRNDDEFADILSDDALIDGQRRFQRTKEMAILATIGLYVLNIIDANVDAHLKQFNVSDDLSMQPNFGIDQFSGAANYGLTFNLNF